MSARVNESLPQCGTNISDLLRSKGNVVADVAGFTLTVSIHRARVELAAVFAHCGSCCHAPARLVN